MVAAKLDQSRVLVTVTKFRQNWLTLKDRSAGQRHTDRDTHRQTRLKIMALQVCNWAKIDFLIIDESDHVSALCSRQPSCTTATLHHTHPRSTCHDGPVYIQPSTDTETSATIYDT